MQGFDQASSVAQIISDFKIVSRQSVYDQVVTLWQSYADKALIYPRLQDQYTRRQVAFNLKGNVWDCVDYTQNGTADKRDQYTEHFQKLWDECNEEISKLEAQAKAIMNIAGFAPMTATAPTPQPVCIGDPNSPLYLGSPLVRPWIPK